MYHVALVDDDRWALKDIRQTFAFERYGFEIVGEYLSAEEALPELIEKKPELIVSDIRMETASGLDMARMCRENGLQSLIVLVSGYEKFEYAQEALRHGVFDYLLKPLQDQAVRELMARIIFALGDSEDQPPEAFGDDSLGLAMRYIGEHYQASLSLETVAGALFINKNYLSELFSKKLGMTFTQYKNKLRIRHAKQLIASGKSSMTEISLLVGFDSSSRFSKVFRLYEGITPQDYRRLCYPALSKKEE